MMSTSLILQVPFPLIVRLTSCVWMNIPTGLNGRPVCTGRDDWFVTSSLFPHPLLKSQVLRKKRLNRPSRFRSIRIAPVCFSVTRGRAHTFSLLFKEKSAFEKCNWVPEQQGSYFFGSSIFRSLEGWIERPRCKSLFVSSCTKGQKRCMYITMNLRLNLRGPSIVCFRICQDLLSVCSTSSLSNSYKVRLKNVF